MPTEITGPVTLLENRACAYGDGLFETMRVHYGQVPLWPYHWRRLRQGAARLWLDCPSESRLQKAIARCLEKVCSEHPSTQQGIIKLVLFRQAKPEQRGYCPAGKDSAFAIRFDPAPPVDNTTVETARVILCSLRLAWQPALAGLKHLSRLENVLACNEVQAAGYDDGLLLDADDNLIEATASNLVFVRGQQLITPDLSRCGVSGVALSWLKDHFPVTVETVPVSSLDRMDAILLCNSVRGFRQVRQVAEYGLATEGQKKLASTRINEIMQTWQAVFRPTSEISWKTSDN